MTKQKRKIIRDMLFEVYDKGVQNEECNLDFYYENMNLIENDVKLSIFLKRA